MDERYGNEPGDPKAIWAHKHMKDAQTGVEKWRKAAKEADQFQAGAHFARADLEALVGQQVFLELYVKTTRNWRDNPSVLEDMGYIFEGPAC